MPKLQNYYRPNTVEEAHSLLSREGVTSVLLAGGTQLNAHLTSDVEAVIDLQAVGLDQITHSQDRLVCGAMVRLQTLVEDEQAPTGLREMARREGPNTFRNAGTIGGSIAAANGESEFVAALLVHETMVTMETNAGTQNMPLHELLEDLRAHLKGAIITGVTLDKAGETADARVARTPADQPIVAAIARRNGAGDMRLALCGVADVPVLVAPDQLDTLEPPADFRGSSTYRKEMAHVLAARVLRAI